MRSHKSVTKLSFPAKAKKSRSGDKVMTRSGKKRVFEERTAMREKLAVLSPKIINIAEIVSSKAVNVEARS